MITAKSQPFTPAYPWGTRTGTAAKTSGVLDLTAKKREGFAGITEIKIPSIFDIYPLTIQVVSDMDKAVLLQKKYQTGVFIKNSNVNFIDASTP